MKLFTVEKAEFNGEPDVKIDIEKIGYFLIYARREMPK